jgi:hypothetical protein
LVLGFEFDLYQTAWIKQFSNLENFRQKYSDRWPTQHEEFPEGNKLGSWCSDQRKKFKKGKVSLDKKEKLDGIGFPWSFKTI